MDWEVVGVIAAVFGTAGAGSIVLGRATWKLASTLTKLADAVDHLTGWFEDHETRIRSLESAE